MLDSGASGWFFLFPFGFGSFMLYNVMQVGDSGSDLNYVLTGSWLMYGHGCLLGCIPLGVLARTQAQASTQHNPNIQTHPSSTLYL